MFFVYPIQATAENWLHECLVSMLTDIHAKLDAGRRATQWPSCVPAAHRDDLGGRYGLRDRLRSYTAAARKLDANQRAQVLRCLSAQNEIGTLLSCTTDCECLLDMPIGIRAAIKSLFDFAYELVKELGIRNRHYRTIYESTKEHICPFCGVEYFDAPVTDGDPAPHVSEDTDHYLPRDRYPFAAANLRNLSPMGGRCNSYKHQKDILHDANGARRLVFDPYQGTGTSISLTNSQPFCGTGGRLPDWTIEFQPHSEMCNTWDSVFSVKQRWKRDVLDPLFGRWVQEFATWYVKQNAATPPTTEQLSAALLNYADNEAVKGLAGREFFRTLTIRMLHHHFTQGHERLVQFLSDSVNFLIAEQARN